MNTVEVVVFGIADEAPTGTCSCGGACASKTDATMGDLSADLAAFLQKSSIGECVKARFVDVLDDDLNAYPKAQVLFRNGFALPFVMINGNVRFWGGINNDMVLEEVVKASGEPYNNTGTP